MDPMTISLLLQAGTAAYGAITSEKKKKEYEAEAAKQKAKRDQAFADLSNIDFSPGSGIYELQQQRQLAAELKGSEALRRQEDKQSRAISALAEDPRNVGATLRMTGQDQSDAILARQGQEKTSALVDTVAAEEEARKAKQQFDKELGLMKYGEAAGTEEAFRSASFAEDAAQRQGIMDFGSSTAETFMTMGAQRAAAERQTEYLDYLREKDAATGTPTSTDTSYTVNLEGKASDAGTDAATGTPTGTETGGPTPDLRSVLDNAYDGSDSLSDAEIDAANRSLLSRETDREANQAIIKNFGEGPYVDPMSPEGVLLEERIQNEKYGIDPTGQSRRNPRTLDLDALGLGEGALIPEEGGGYFYDYGEDFADGGKTKGEYDHATNKKAIIDEENGQKEGEMTGGEFILPEYFVEDVEGLRKRYNKAMKDKDSELAQEILNQIGRKYLEFTSADRFQEV